ncbi:hypothetical protein ACWA2B_00325 [Paenibacillus sp. CMM36]|uniref:hypothetical protein n=1 Tax=Paenibacillus polymyxa TaxID=1406 RepID=UPI00298C6129|nr:hypothetical protein [Paenibacillus polymyxa]
MASEKTPNLGLNQIDRTSPKTTYFDLEKYLDENWRSVDEFAGDVNDGVNEIKKRLDTTERKTVTLEPGVQMVHAEKAAPFSLTGLSGRTLVNLLGRMGSCETVSEWSSNVAIAIDSNSKTNGSSSFKITLGSASATASASFLTTPGRKYIAIADVKSGNTSKVAISINGIAGAVGNEVTSGSVFAPSVVRFTAKDYFHVVTITGTGAVGNIFNMDSVRVYEISDADYTAAASLTPVQATAKYPYVDSVMPVRNPYAIRYGENLIPPFYEWTLGERAKVMNPYKLETAATVSVDQSNTYVAVSPGVTYTFSVKVNGRVTVVEVDDLGTESNVYSTTNNENRDVTVTFTTKTTTKRVRIYATNTGAGTYTLENPMLNIGSTAKPFKPREDSMLALQTDLYADPVTGANADTVYERDGQYFKSKKWQGLTLDGSLAWTYFDKGTDYKVVRLPVANGLTDTERITKFDGKLVQHVFPTSAADQSHLSASAGVVGLSISVADSGWGDGYQPDQNDIKAYFFGYKVYDAGTFTPTQAQAATTATWNGTGAKYYVPRVGPANPVASAPQQSYAGYTPYQLVYQLATPTVEPIVSEGKLSFTEGDNQVEVGTGIVLREATKPTSSLVGDAYLQINRIDYGTAVKYRVSKFLAVYVGNRKDSGWEALNPPDNQSYGLERLRKSSSQITTEPYSVTYLMLDPSPVVPFTGSYAANEKTLLADLVDSVQQNTARVSVLENKKADKDNPAVLTPTLLNGVTLEYPTSPVEYRKSSDGLVTIQGSVKPSSTGDIVAFMLPAGYRPKQTVAVALAGNTGTSDIMVRGVVLSGGQVQIGNSVPLIWVRLDGIQFIAER